MNRQTLVVIGVTLALLALGAALLYGQPAEPPAVVETRSNKAQKVDKAKTKPEAPARRTEAQRTVQREIPEDRPAARADAPNVVLVVMSTQRRDQWSVYGGQTPTTPFLAEQARGGVVFTDALAAAVDCPPGLAAIVTGRYPHALGAVNVAPRDGQLQIAARASTLAEQFAGAGWHTVGLTATHVLNRGHGGDQGFDVYVDAQEDSLNEKMRISGADLVRTALSKVEPADRPLFLQLVFADSHKPQIRLGTDESAPFDDPRPEVAAYRATIRRQDDAVASLVAGLAERGLTAQNTLFVVLADHGEGLRIPDRHRPQHGLVLYPSSVSIPWVMWGKTVARGKKVDGLASSIDLAPTLLALAGVPAVEGTDGLDLSAVVRKGGRSPREEAYADTFLDGFHRASIWTVTHQCQQDYGSVNRPKDDDFAPACFDRRADPEFAKPIDRVALAQRLEAVHGARLAQVPAP